MLRPYFRYNRTLLKELCRIARDCLIDYQREILQLPDGIGGAVMVVHTFGEYLDFHPHLHALVADGLFQRGGWFHVLPKTGIRPLEELFRARTIAFLVKEGLLPPDRARMLLGWKHSGFCVHCSKRVQPDQKEDLERLAQYIIRNPFSVEKMHPDPASGTIIYRSGMNPKIRLQLTFALLTPAHSCRLSPFGRLEIFTPCDFIAAITQHIPDKNFQLVRYYGWYSNKMRGQRNKQLETEGRAGESSGGAVEIIDVSEHRPRRPPSPKWRELIKKVWEADPLLCPTCSREMRIVSLIDEREVIVRILRHLGLWEDGAPLHPARAPPSREGTVELIPGDPFPDYSREPLNLGTRVGSQHSLPGDPLAVGFPALQPGSVTPDPQILYPCKPDGYNYCYYMAYKTKVRKIGNSLGIVLPKEALQAMKVEEGATLYITEAPKGSVHVTPEQKDFDAMMQVAEKGMQRYRNALRKLAE